MKKYIRGKNFVGNYEIRKAIENDPTQPVRKCLLKQNQGIDTND